MDSKCGRTATKRPHWKGFRVWRTAFSCCDMERDCCIRVILPYHYRNRNCDRNRILNPCSQLTSCSLLLSLLWLLLTFLSLSYILILTLPFPCPIPQIFTIHVLTHLAQYKAVQKWYTKNPFSLSPWYPNPLRTIYCQENQEWFQSRKKPAHNSSSTHDPQLFQAICAF